MPRTEKRKRAKIAKLRSCIFDGKPWSIMPSAMSTIVDAFGTGDIHSIESALAFGTESDSETKVLDGVAVIPITGVLRDDVDFMVRFGFATSYQVVEQELKQAIANPQVKSIVLFMDTPGGSAIGCKRVADAVSALRGQKPIVAYSQTVCGSAGYYIASACDRMEGTEDSLWGSIGTIYNHVEASKAYEEFGFGVTVITNNRSPKKGHGNQFEPLSDEARKTLSAFIDSYGEGFIGDVARYRETTPDQVVETYGQGDAFRADVALNRGMIDKVVPNLQSTLDRLTSASSAASPVAEAVSIPMSKAGHRPKEEPEMKFGKKVRAQLFALGLIADIDAADEACQTAVAAFFVGRGQEQPADEAGLLSGLQSNAKPTAVANEDEEEETEDEDDEENASSRTRRQTTVNKVQQAHDAEQKEARIADLRASAELINKTVGREAVTASMILDAVEKKLDAKAAISAWNESISAEEPAVPSARVIGSGSDRYAADIVDALVYRSSDNPGMQLSAGASALVGRPLWAVAGECLQLAGNNVDMYGDREALAEEAMQMGDATRRQKFYSSREDRRYVNATGIPASRPGDFPNILSSLANKFLDSIELDNDYSYTAISALLPGGLNDFKPALMVNKGVVEELDEVQDAEQFKELGLEEEVLSYIFLRRFGNKFGWTPVLVANDDLNAFAEGMIGLREAWEVTQNRLVVDRFTSNENLLDGSPLFADRANTGSGNNPALNNNLRTGGGAPSDTEWGAMETQYADIGGIGTGRRVRGALNVCFTPTGARLQEARRTFMPLNTGGLESKSADTTANVGIYRGEVGIVPESELRISSTTTWFGLQSPTRLNKATVVRAYFNGYGTQGRRERWYDPDNKTTWVSLEGRMASAVKNWRYAIKNQAS